MVVVTIDLDELARRQRGDRASRRAFTQAGRRNPSAEQGILIDRAAAGDLEAFQWLYARYSARIYGYLLQTLRDEYEAEDVLQLVFIRLLAKLPLYRRTEGSFQSWLLTMARNVALDQLRKRRAFPHDSAFKPGATAEDASSERANCLRDAFSALPEDQRSVAMMRHIIGLSPGEIARRLGRSEASVHGLHNRARTTLRSTLIELDCRPSVLT